MQTFESCGGVVLCCAHGRSLDDLNVRWLAGDGLVLEERAFPGSQAYSQLLAHTV